MSPHFPINSLLWLAVGESTDPAPALARIGYTNARVEVRDVPGGLLPIDVVVSHSADLHAIAAECKVGMSCDPDQWGRYLALEPNEVSKDFGSPILKVEPCYVVRDDAKDQFCESLDEAGIDPDGLPLLTIRKDRIRLPGPGRFRRNSLNVAFAGQGARLPEEVPPYVDVLPGDSQQDIRRFTVRQLPHLLRIPSHKFPTERVASVARIWHHLSVSGREQMIASIGAVLHDLNRNELKGWLARVRGEPGHWRVYKHAQRARGQQELADLIRKARIRWGAA